jgi:steroid 5-alpha reductase family enzyme
VTGRGMPRWARALNRVSWTAIPDADDGRGVRLNRVIDLHKGLTGPVVLALMIAFDVFTTPAWIYLALHGSYGLAWVLKDRTFPDRQWQRRVRWSGALATWAFLTLYWVAPAILVLGTAGVIDTGGWDPVGAPGLAAAVALYALGLVLMAGADAQKNITLRERADRRGEAGAGAGPGSAGPGLITTGFYARVRHPNYLGEMMIYGAFALVVGHWLPAAVLSGVWLLFFVPNMLAIDASLARYPEFPAWKARTGLVLPALPGSRRR